MTLGQTLILLFLRNILGGLDQPATNPVSFQEVAGRRTISMRLKNGSAPVPGAPSRRPAEWPWQQILSLFSGVSQGSDAFGETPKAAGEDARAPQFFRMVPAICCRVEDALPLLWGLFPRSQFQRLSRISYPECIS